MLATADKLYRVRSETQGVTKGVGWAPGVAPSLPQTLIEGRTGRGPSADKRGIGKMGCARHGLNRFNYGYVL